jgi:hypothetical protein
MDQLRDALWPGRPGFGGPTSQKQSVPGLGEARGGEAGGSRFDRAAALTWSSMLGGLPRPDKRSVQLRNDERDHETPPVPFANPMVVAVTCRSRQPIPEILRGVGSAELRCAWWWTMAPGRRGPLAEHVDRHDVRIAPTEPSPDMLNAVEGRGGDFTLGVTSRMARRRGRIRTRLRGADRVYPRWENATTGRAKIARSAASILPLRRCDTFHRPATMPSSSRVRIASRWAALTTG